MDTTATHSYVRIADTLRARIIDGSYLPGEFIPTASALEAEFSVSNITIRKAVSKLADEGWVTGIRGAGTMVAKEPESKRVDIRISGTFSDWLDTASGRTHPVDIEQEVLGVDEVRGPAAVRAALGIAGTTKLWRMRRVRRIHGEPISYHVNYVPQDIGSRLKAEDLRDGGSFVGLLQRSHPEPLTRIDQHVEAATTNIDLAHLLGVTYGKPIFFVENVYQTERRPAAVTHLYLRGDRYCYSATIDCESSDGEDRK